MPVTLQTSSTGFPSSTFLSFGFSVKTGGMPSKMSAKEDCLDKLKREDGKVSEPWSEKGAAKAKSTLKLERRNYKSADINKWDEMVIAF